MADLLFELITEELPPKDVARVARALEVALGAALTEAGLPAESTAAAWTPRRIALFARGLAERSPDVEEERRGPPENVAFDADGNPTRAGAGFAKKNGVGVDALVRRDGRVFATCRTEGRPALSIAAALLPALPARAPWRKTMRWGVDQTFARPIRGVVALLGGEVVPCEIAGEPSGRSSQGHPFLAPGPVELAGADRNAYVEALRAAFVLADPEERRAAVRATTLAAAPDAEIDDALLEEVTNLVEWPTAMVGNFADRFLELPARLLTTAMAHHQRFFPVRREDGGLAPRFVVVLDRDETSVEVCRPGFERVLVPRLHDAAFFMHEDRKQPLAERLPRLEDVLFHRKLGTLRDKASRLERLAASVAGLLGHDEETQARAGRAGLLAKCDLVTHLVGEFPELQGYVGAVYAAADGEPTDVCEGIANQYRHRFEDGETLPTAAVAACLAEHLDSLCQFGTRVGLPKGNTDPFGVRRSTLSALELTARFAPDAPLAALVAEAGGDADVLAYLRKRLRQRARDLGARPDHLDALAARATIGSLEQGLEDLAALSGKPAFDRLLEVAERCRNITKKADVEAVAVDPALLEEPAERALHAAWEGVRADLPPGDGVLRGSYVAQLAEALAEPLHTFFEKVFVNAEDAAVRRNRHALLRAIDRTLLRFGDLCRIVRA